MSKILPQHAMACPPGGPLDYPMIGVFFSRTNSLWISIYKIWWSSKFFMPLHWLCKLEPQYQTQFDFNNFEAFKIVPLDVPLFHIQILRKRDLLNTFLLHDFQMDPTSSAVPCWGQTGLSMAYSFYSQGRDIHGLHGAEEFVAHPTYIADLILRLASGPWTGGCGWFQFLAKYTCSLC